MWISVAVVCNCDSHCSLVVDLVDPYDLSFHTLILFDQNPNGLPDQVIDDDPNGPSSDRLDLKSPERDPVGQLFSRLGTNPL